MAKRRRVIFTDNKQSDRGIMSIILGGLCTVSLFYCFIVSYRMDGAVPERFGAALFITLIFAIAGLSLGIVSRMDVTKFKLVPTIGIVVNAVAVCVLAFLLWIGLK